MLSTTGKWLKSWVIAEPARSTYAYNAATLDNVIRDDEWLELLTNDHDPRIVNVALQSSNEYYNAPDLGFRFKLGWGNRILSTCPLVLFFPNHPDKDQHILYTDKAGSLSNLDVTINERIAQSKTHDNTSHARLPLMAVASGAYIYRIWDIDRNHNIYVYWLTRLNKYNVTGQCDPLRTHVPVIVEMDGASAIINLVPLDFEPYTDRPEKIHMPLDLRAHERTYITIQGGETLFNLEKPPSRNGKDAMHNTPLKTVSQAKAANDIRAMNMDPGFHTLCAETLPLEESFDQEDSASLSASGSGRGWGGVHYTQSSSRSGSDYGEDSDVVIGEGMLMEMISHCNDDSDSDHVNDNNNNNDIFVPDESVYTSEDSRDSASSK